MVRGWKNEQIVVMVYVSLHAGGHSNYEDWTMLV
jgi:hypothetical protein